MQFFAHAHQHRSRLGLRTILTIHTPCRCLLVPALVMRELSRCANASPKVRRLRRPAHPPAHPPRQRGRTPRAPKMLAR